MFMQLRTHLQNKSWFLVLLPVFFVARGYNDFFSLFPASFVSLNLAAVFLFTAIVYFCSLFFVDGRKKATLFTFFFTLFVLTFGFLHDGLKSLFPKFFLSSYRFLLPCILLMTVTLLLLLKRQKKATYKKLFLYLNTVFIFLMIYETGNAFSNYIKYNQGALSIDSRFNAYKQFEFNKSVPDSLNPDIYFLVFDAMPSTKAMKEYWGYDNSLLDSLLLHNNFFISGDSRSNYNHTVLSISTTLNMDYLPGIDQIQVEPGMYFKASESILNNSLTKILYKKGYKINQYQAISFNNSDWNSALIFEDMLYMNYFYRTLPGRIWRDIGWNMSKIPIKSFKNFNLSQKEKRELTRERDLHQTVEFIKKSCTLINKQPKFTYAHFLLPHSPYIFDSSGKRKPTDLNPTQSAEEPISSFIEQVKFANKIINDLVSFIKTKNKKNTIIIIEGDHGFRNETGKKDYMVFDNLNAFYFPDNDYKLLYNSISPVNSFRITLNHIFSAKLPLLKDTSIFIPYGFKKEENSSPK
jgi:Sulfatase